MLPPGHNRPWTPLLIALCIHTHLSLCLQRAFHKKQELFQHSLGLPAPLGPAACPASSLAILRTTWTLVLWEMLGGIHRQWTGMLFWSSFILSLHQWWSWLKIQYPDPATLEKSESPALANFWSKAQSSLCLFLHPGPPWSPAKVQPLCLGWNFLTKWTNTTYEMDKITHRAFKEEQPNLLLWKKPSL